MQLLILLDRTRRESLTEQLVEQIRQAIARGRIAGGSRLPSSRNLADQLGISRNTVVRAYEMLILEGHAEARPASGIFVAAPSETASAEPVTGSASEPPSMSPPPPAIDVAVKRLAPRKEQRMAVDFALDQTSPAVFPLKTWRRLVLNHLSHGATSRFAAPDHSAGAPELRAAIAAHQATARGLSIDASQVIVTGGRTDGLNLIARLVLSYDARVVMEDPCHLGARLAFRGVGAHIIPCPTDEAGLVTDLLPDRGASMVHVTPSHQYPTGALLSASRRRALVAWARRHGSLIVEDGFGDEFHDEGTRLEPLSLLAPDCTLYVGDYSALLGSGLKLGYLIVPQRYADAARLTRTMLNDGASWLDQAVLAEFISSGKLASHSLRVRAHYRAGRNTLVAALRQFFGEVTLSGGNSGLQLFWQLPPGVPQARIFEHQAKRGRIGVYSFGSAPVHDAETGSLAKRGILLGYGALSQRQIEKGIAKLSDIVDDALDDHRTELDQLLVDLPPDRPPIPTSRIRGMAVSGKKHQPALTPGRGGRTDFRKLAPIETGSIMPLLKSIYHYPIKGLSGQPLFNVRLTKGKPFPHDRQFAFARPGVPLQADNPRWAKKGLFVMLMLEEALAKVKTHLDPETLHFEVRAGNQTILTVNLAEPEARGVVEDYFHQLVPSLPAPPTLVRSREGHFMDKPDSVISLINLATLRSLEERWGTEIDPLRFRANLYVDTGRAWEEFDWVDQEITIGDVTFRVDRRNGRCGATNVNPASGARDMDIPGSLRASFGHKDLGVYLTVESSGTIALDDRLTAPFALVTQPAPAPVTTTNTGRRFICRGCYYIYSEAAGVPADGIAAGTTYQRLPETYRCPDCGTDKGKLRPHVG